MLPKNIELPGLVDVHVHLREPGAEEKEDFSSGTKAAIAGGYTQVLDMPNNPVPTISTAAFNQKVRLAKNRIWCDLGFNFGGIPDSIKYFEELKNKVFGLKVYMNQTTGTLLVHRPKDREKVFKSWKSSLPIMVHAEGETVEIALKFAKKYKKSLHVCHMTADQIEPIADAKRKGLDITCEVCPHHLFLNKDDLKKLGPLGMMKPQLLTKKGQEKLWANLDKIDAIATDHAPHTLDEKYDPVSLKFGVPGLETTLALMLQAVSQKKLTLQKLTDMLCTSPRKIFNLPSQKETKIIVDTTKTYKISSIKLFTKCGWTPFSTLIGRGKIKKVIIRGKTIFDNGKFVGKPSGIIMKPQI